MLKKSLRKIAKKAGFMFWGNETWGPGKNHIDWAAQYDDEFDQYHRLLNTHICNMLIKQLENIEHLPDEYREGFTHAVLESVQMVNEELG